MINDKSEGFGLTTILFDSYIRLNIIHIDWRWYIQLFYLSIILCCSIGGPNDTPYTIDHFVWAPDCKKSIVSASGDCEGPCLGTPF